VAQFILDRPAEVMHLTCRALGRRCQSSEATVVRLCQTLGFQGYHHLRTALPIDLLAMAHSPYEEVRRDDPPAQVIQKVLRLSVQALEDTIRTLDPIRFAQAVEGLHNARRVEFYGIGWAASIAQNASLTFLRLNVTATAVTDPIVQLKSAALLTKEDVAVGVSHSGSTEHVVSAVRIARGRKATTIAITNLARSPLAKAAEIVLLTGARPLLLGSQAGPPRIAQLGVIDALATGVILRQFR
jgi:DNA-binding MurR/RpiR family transcriptional regulator